jgi:hypothetical protein
MVGSHGWVPWLGPKDGSQVWSQGWVPSLVPRFGPKVGSQGWVPKLQLPSPNEGLVSLLVTFLSEGVALGF